MLRNEHMSPSTCFLTPLPSHCLVTLPGHTAWLHCLVTLPGYTAWLQHGLGGCDSSTTGQAAETQHARQHV